jgi:hypothetical protein
MKIFCKLLPAFAVVCLPLCTLSQGQGHANVSADRVPKDVLCTGIPDYPKGWNGVLPSVMRGNLQEGFYTSDSSADGVIVFLGLMLTKPNTLEGEFLKIDGLTNLPAIPMVGPDKGKGQGIVKLPAFHGETTCTVKSWYR